MAEARPHDKLESPRLPGMPFALTAAGVFVFLALAIGGLWTVFVAAVPDRVPQAAQEPPAPRLLANPPIELQSVWAAQSARLQGYHWVDRADRIASIPIDRAMAIVAARGKDAYGPIPGAPPAPATQQAPATETGAPP